ncbi:uncharacterized protein LOC113528873 isoform X4 [Pangasianodon hypophthalmus]|uniref:uncharacterized protein LOC113528873 isoform X4 n=1 Tax=Pangasianodon hypophthalmus TaxID=310915 RepID=UPI002307FAFD|nr:uncharacterized protein LOC113528873 isoform X4 [Pangasianodon hypophthalmus]
MIIRYNERLKSNRSPDVPLRTVSVTCSPSAMEVHIKADLFDLGVPVNPEHVTLGERCGVTKASSEEFIIHTALTDCGTRYWLTADALVYTNMLVYAPVPSVDGVIRQEKTSVPVECAYRRRFGVDSVSVVPTWLPHLSAHSAEHTLHFALRLMSDGQQTNSTSQFLPRIQSDKLHLQLHTFIFRQVHSAQIFISCSLKAELQSSSSSRACSYIQGSWRSADGDHSVCESCRTSDQFRQNDVERRNTQAGSAQMEPGELELGTPGSMWKNPEHADTHVQALQQEVLAGPLSLSSWRSEVSPSAVLEGVHITHIPSLKTKRLTAHALQGNVSTPGSEYQLTITEEKAEWESRVSTEREMGVSLVTPTPELHLTVTPLMFTTLEMTNTVFKTKSTAAAGIPTLTANMTNHLPFITPPHHHRPSPGNLLLLLRMAPHSQPKVLGGCCGWYHTDTLKMVADGLTCIVERLHLLKTIYAQVSFIIQWITSI